MDERPPDRSVTLANGSTLSLSIAVAKLGLLQSYWETPDLEWDALFYLREVCLGRSIEPEQERTLVREGLLLNNGQTDPAMKAVVLSAVRGEEKALTLESPFTDHLDKAMADFILSRDYIRSHLSEQDATAFFANDDLQSGLDQIEAKAKSVNAPKDLTDRIVRRVRNWSDRPSDPGTPSGGKTT